MKISKKTKMKVVKGGKTTETVIQVVEPLTIQERNARLVGDGIPRTYASDLVDDHDRFEHTGT